MEFSTSLKLNHIFRRLYSTSGHANTYLVLYARRNRSKENRVGLTCGTKLGHAVVRNRIRRRIREAYRLSEQSYVLGYDIVVVARHRAVDASYQEIAQCLAHQMSKLGLIRKERTDEAADAVSDPVLPE